MTVLQINRNKLWELLFLVASTALQDNIKWPWAFIIFSSEVDGTTTSIVKQGFLLSHKLFQKEPFINKGIKHRYGITGSKTLIHLGSATPTSAAG